MSDLIYSSAVMSLSQTTEFMRNKSIDNTVIHLIVQKQLKDFTIKSAYDAIHTELPIRLEEIEKSLNRSIKTKIVSISNGSEEDLRNAKLEISKTVIDKLDAQYHQLNDFLKAATYELFVGAINGQNENDFKFLLLETVTNLMAKYGFAYAGQLAGIAEATEFVPAKELSDICENMLKKYILPINKKDLSTAISYLFDRRDPCLNNLAFSICNRYYNSRLIGLDLPIDFLTSNLYNDSIIFLDTNFIGNIAFSGSKRHNEFREILKNSKKLGIRFAASELTIAEIHARVQDYMPDLEIGQDLIPEELLQEVRDDIIQKSQNTSSINNFKLEESENYIRLKDMGIEIIKFNGTESLYSKPELNEIMDELRIFDRKYRSQHPPKDERALYHDAYHYFLVKSERAKKESNSAWFLTMDHSVVEHSIAKKTEDNPPYSLRLLSFLQTLSQFVESQALKGEFTDLFGELIAKDLLPRDQLFDYNDLKLLIGFDIKAREIPPEFVRKATFHIKKNILKGGGITDENRAEVIHEFTKYFSTPDQNFLELQRKFDKKLFDRDEDIKEKEKQLKELEELKRKEHEKSTIIISEKESETKVLKSEVTKLKHYVFCSIVIFSGIGLSLLIWLNKFDFYEKWLTKFNTPVFFNLSIQIFIFSTILFFVFPNKQKLIIIAGALVTLASIIGSLA